MGSCGGVCRYATFRAFKFEEVQTLTLGRSFSSLIFVVVPLSLPPLSSSCSLCSSFHFGQVCVLRDLFFGFCLVGFWFFTNETELTDSVLALCSIESIVDQQRCRKIAYLVLSVDLVNSSFL